GKTFFSKTHQLIIDRDFLIISPVDINKPDKYFVDAGAIKIGVPVELNFERLSVTGKIIIDPDKNVAQFDFDKLKFPLKLRRWEEGDSFHPFGMLGRKKVSDYFTDNKFSLLDKQKTWILLSEDKIAWIVGHRIDDRFKIDNQTKTIYKISLIANS
ncbi:MAG: tRNA(Ile)-lysidine synthetase, partial [Bacteroidetes bacterium 4572_114]